MDETALAIARLREDAKPDKSSGPDRLASDDLKAKRGLARNITGHPEGRRRGTIRLDQTPEDVRELS